MLISIPFFRTAFSLGFVVLLLFPACPAFATSATWLSTPGSGNWNTNENWSPTTGFPNAEDDTATFDSSTITSVSLASHTTVDNIVFNVGASPFTITMSSTLTLELTGGGIINQFLNTQNFVTNDGRIVFTGSATAGVRTAFTNNGDGQTIFLDAANAGQGDFTNKYGGGTHFGTTASAGSGVFTNQSGVDGEGAEQFGGSVSFGGSATADQATIINEGVTAGGLTAGSTDFFGNARAGNATLTAHSGSGGGPGGSIYFRQDSTGDTATVRVFGNGSLNLNLHNPGSVTIGSLEGTGQVVFGTNSLIVGSNDKSTVFSGVLQSGSDVSLTKIGTGTLSLAGSGAFTGHTTVSEGTLQIGDGGTTGALSPAQAITTKSVLAFNRSNTTEQGNDFGLVSGTGGITQHGSGTTILTAANTYTGATTIIAGALQIGNGGMTGGLSSTGTIIDNALLIFNRSNTMVQGYDFGAISGTGGVTKNGSGDLVLTATNTHSGVTTINDGVVIVDHDGLTTFGTLGSGATIVSGTNSSTGELRFLGSANVGHGIFTNRYGGETRFGNAQSADSGTFTNEAGVASESSSALLSGGRLSFSGSATADQASIINEGVTGGGSSSGSTDFSGNARAGNATLTAHGGSGGGQGGSIYFRHDSTGDTATVRVFGNGSLNLNLHNPGSVTIGSLEGTGQVVLGTNSLIVGSNDKSTIHSGAIQGTGSLTKIGSGTLALSGSSSYSGGTTLNGGTLLVGSGEALGTGTVVVAGGLFLVETAENVTIENEVLLSGIYQRNIIGALPGSVDATSALGGTDTEATVLQGYFATRQMLTTSFSTTSGALNDDQRVSDVYHFDGTGSDRIGLQLSLGAGPGTTDMRLAWLDPATNTWINAILGNGPSSRPHGVYGPYSAPVDFTLGSYGVDVSTGSYWAVIDHTGDFAIIAVPEPATWALVGFSLAGIFLLRRQPRNLVP